MVTSGEIRPGSSAFHAQTLKNGTGSAQGKALGAGTPPIENHSKQILSKRRATLLDICQYPRTHSSKPTAGSAQNRAQGAGTTPVENYSKQIPAKRRAAMLDICQYPRENSPKRQRMNVNDANTGRKYS